MYYSGTIRVWLLPLCAQRSSMNLVLWPAIRDVDFLTHGIEHAGAVRF
jgi:hypothetical protein